MLDAAFDYLVSQPGVNRECHWHRWSRRDSALKIPSRRRASTRRG